MDFEKQVISKSFEKPVLVDFWAEWCGPCRMLGPVLEQLAEEQKDRWTLVKVNTEEEPELSNSYSIKSIPAVKLFHQGEVIGEFAGAIPKTSIVNWLNSKLPDKRKDVLTTLLEAIKKNDSRENIKKLEAFVSENSDLKDGYINLARLLLFSKPEKALELLAPLKMGMPEYEQVEDLKSLAKVVLHEPNGSPVSNSLSKAREAFQNKDLETAIQQLIEAVGIDKSYENDLPRKAAIAFFRLFPDHKELIKNYRWRFDMALY